jgi:hypothetical protein
VGIDLSNILVNFVSSILTNPITVAFLIFITTFAVVKILDNSKLYAFIDSKLIELNTNQDTSSFYNEIKIKYDEYSKEHKYSDVNITSFIEEIISELKYNNRSLLDKINSIKNASSICILFGVLGTFVGLSTMLLSVNTSDIVNSLPATISSMQTAFLTSIFGIVFSIIITSITRTKDCEHILVRLMLKTENILTSQVTHKKSEHMDVKIEEVKNTIKHISKSIESIEKFDKISQDLTEFNEEFINGIKNLKSLLEGSESSIKTFDQSIRKLDKQFSILNVKFNKLFEKYDRQDDISREMLFDLKESTKNITNATESQYKIKDYIKNINAGFAIYERSAQDMLSKLISHENEMTVAQRNLLEEKVTLDYTVNSLADVVADFSLDIQDKLDKVFDKSLDIQDKLNMTFDTSIMEEYDLIDYKDFIDRLVEKIDIDQEILNDRDNIKLVDQNDYSNDNLYDDLHTEIEENISIDDDSLKHELEDRIGEDEVYDK